VTWHAMMTTLKAVGRFSKAGLMHKTGLEHTRKGAGSHKLVVCTHASTCAASLLK
jgi:hypothetical protein